MNGATAIAARTDPEQLLPAGHAWQRIAASIAVVPDSEVVSLADALGRVLAAPLTSPRDVPGHTNAAVDGYACRFDCLPAADADARSLDVVGKAMAGAPTSATVQAGQCVRIMTGAVLPGGADLVVMQEDVLVDGAPSAFPGEGGNVRIGSGHRAGQNVRERGEDIAAGAEVLAAGTRLLPAHLGLIASMGLATVTAKRKLCVALLSTGDEVRQPGEALREGEVYDSNRPMLLGLLHGLNVNVIDLGALADDRDLLRSTLVDAASRADVVLSSGGASTGEADYVQPLLDELGAVGFWRIAVRPGRPLAFGRVGDAAFFGLPGNPIAVLVTYWQFVAPALRRMMGEADALPPPTLRARLTAPLRKKPERLEFYRAIVSRDASGDCVVQQTGKPGSGLLHTVTDANCFIVLAHDVTAPAVGEWVDVQPFHGLY